MVDLATGTVVRVVNPSQVVEVTAPGFVRGVAILAGPAGPAGRNVTSVARTSGTGAAGTTDTYTITYSDATTSTFAIYNGANGAAGAAGANGTNGTNGTNGVGVPTGGTTGQVLAKNSATNYDTVWSTPSSGAGTVLARVDYNPTAVTTFAATTTNADISAANLAITFTPTTTEATIYLEAAASNNTLWSLRLGTTNVAGTTRKLQPSGTGATIRAATSIKLTGLTAGVPVTYKWAHRYDTGSGSMVLGGPTASEFTGGANTYYGPAIMEARSA